MASLDNIISLCEDIERDNFKYFLVIVKPRAKNSTQDELELFFNLEKNEIDKLATALKKAKIYKDKRQDKKDIKNKTKKDENET